MACHPFQTAIPMAYYSNPSMKVKDETDSLPAHIVVYFRVLVNRPDYGFRPVLDAPKLHLSDRLLKTNSTHHLI